MAPIQSTGKRPGAGRQRLILGNWKMHGSRSSNAALLDALRRGFTTLPADAQTLQTLQAGVCVPYPYLAQVQAALANTSLRWGAQDVSAWPAGAHTGDVCASMLADFGVRWVLVGHSERRIHHGEDALLVARKAQAALHAGLSPVVCLGETLAQHQSGQTARVIAEQLAPVLELNAEALAEIVFAYEPVWAIGTGQSATPEQAQAVHAAIRSQLAACNAPHRPILYGGSVKADNATDLMRMPDIDGALVGGASLDAKAFLSIVAAAADTHPTECH